MQADSAVSDSFRHGIGKEFRLKRSSAKSSGSDDANGSLRNYDLTGYTGRFALRLLLVFEDESNFFPFIRISGIRS
jgi:hypothetical protein